jgi:hypothetical protein
MNSFKSSLSATLMILFVFLISCAENQNPEQQPAAEQTEPADETTTPEIVLKGDDIVLARVSGSPITRYELELTIDASLGAATASRLKPEDRRKILESLVTSRAIALAQQQNSSAVELAELEKKVQAYREQLLVKQYLARHTSPQPVSAEMVQEYYEKHPERFGAQKIRTYEMIFSRQELSPAARQALIRVLSQAADMPDWRQWVKILQQQGHAVDFKEGQVTEKILHPRLRQLMQPLKKGETSRLAFVKGSAYVVRIVEDRQVAARPLPEVSAQIRKALVPVQLKKAIKEVSAQVLETAEVIYEKK